MISSVDENKGGLPRTSSGLLFLALLILGVVSEILVRKGAIAGYIDYLACATTML